MGAPVIAEIGLKIGKAYFQTFGPIAPTTEAPVEYCYIHVTSVFKQKKP